MKNSISRLILGLASLLFIFSVGSASAQNVAVTGNVKDANGEPVAGAMVMVEGTMTVATTNEQGRYSIVVPGNSAVLTFSLLGYAKVSEAVGTRRLIDVVMAEDAKQIDRVVVTALGLLRKEKSLTYSAQVVGGDELTRVQDPNFMNSLAGKTAGVQINRSAAGIGGSAKVIIRGSRSINFVGGPLYVIDGVPIGGTGDGGTNTVDSFGAWQGGHDTGDAISNLNPDDIASMSVLKGASAAALYGTQAGNGVILITTKKGAVGRTDIQFSTNTTFDSAVYGRPKFQNSYGGASTSWGKPINKSVDYLKDFFQTGVTTINSLSLSSGTEKMQTYFSYANTYSKGVVPGNKLNKHNFNFRETASFLKDRLKLDANITMMYQRMENLLSPGGYYMNPLTGLYRFPRGGGIEGGESWEYYRDNYTIYNKSRNMMDQNWPILTDLTEQNPFWIINRSPNDSRRYRALLNLAVSYQFAKHFTMQARGKADYTGNWFEKKLYAGTVPGLVSRGNGLNGYYDNSENFGITLYGDVLLSWQQTFGDWAVSATLGGSISDGHGRSQSVNSVDDGLYNANIFDVDNIIKPRPVVGAWRGAQEQSVFFAGQLGWRDQLFLDVTARNDWSSTLAYTKSMKKGFFYPSVGLSWLMDKSFTMPQWIDMAKVRASWAQVGNGLPGGSSHPWDGMGYGGVYSPNRTAPFGELKPQMTTSIEAGTEWRFFGSRLEFDFTYYVTHTRNQAINLPVLSSSKYNSRWVNAGDIKNEGIEITLTGTPVAAKDFRWKTGFNYSQNRNKIVKLLSGLETDRKFLQVGSENVKNGFDMRNYEGQQFGDIYGYAFERDGVDDKGQPTHEGNIKYDADGVPERAPTSYERKLGNASPKFNLGWNNTFTWKGIHLYFLIDGRFGGQVVSLTEADMDWWGTSKRSGDDRKKGYVDFDGRQIKDVEKFYKTVGARGGVTEHYIYSATNVRMRELSIGYTLPTKWFNKCPWIKGVDLSLVGRNLFFLYLKAPYDPDALMSTGMSMQGVDLYGMPSARSFGFNIKLNF